MSFFHSDELISRIRHWIAFVGPRRLVTGALSLVVVVLVGWWLLRSPAPPIETGIVRVTSTSVTIDSTNSVLVSSTTTLPFITVHVAGAVKNPGVYELPALARVVDALNAAGGHTRSADLDVVNLALPITDSEQVFIPKRGQSTHTGKTPSRRTEIDQQKQLSPEEKPDSANSVININSATATELEELPGVGPSIAKSIVTYRTTNGPFVVPEDLMKVSGIGAAKFGALRAYITV